MSNYYEEVKKANLDIDKMIRVDVLNKGQELDINKACYELTLKYAVSSKALMKRFHDTLRFNNTLRIVDNKLFSVGGGE